MSESTPYLVVMSRDAGGEYIYNQLIVPTKDGRFFLAETEGEDKKLMACTLPQATVAELLVKNFPDRFVEFVPILGSKPSSKDFTTMPTLTPTLRPGQPRGIPQRMPPVAGERGNNEDKGCILL